MMPTTKELIERLALEAGFSAEKHPTNQPKLMGYALLEDGRPTPFLPAAIMERFAQLVAAHCAKLCYMGDGPVGVGYCSDDYADAIRKEFGITE